MAFEDPTIFTPEELAAEEWRDVAEYEGLYQVSNLGRVRSVPRIDCKGARRGGTLLSQKNNRPRAYRAVGLCRNGKTIHPKVHRLVLSAFAGPCPARMEGCHDDGNRCNNRRSNLYWGTRKKNQADRVRHGTSNRGTRNGSAKLSEEAVKEIYEARLARVNQGLLAEKFQIDRSTISRIWSGSRWSSVALE